MIVNHGKIIEKNNGDKFNKKITSFVFMVQIIWLYLINDNKVILIKRYQDKFNNL